MPSPTVQFRYTPRLSQALTARATPEYSANLVAQHHLEMYFTMLRAELRQLQLWRDEALFFCDLLKSTAIEATWAESGPQLLAAEVEDAPLEQLDIKWEVDTNDLSQRARDYTRGQVLALVDAVQRWWSADAHSDPDERLVTVGLVSRAALPTQEA